MYITYMCEVQHILTKHICALNNIYVPSVQHICVILQHICTQHICTQTNICVRNIYIQKTTYMNIYDQTYMCFDEHICFQ